MKKLPGTFQWLIDQLETAVPIEPNVALPEGAVIVGALPEELQLLDGLRHTLFDAVKESAERGMEAIKAIEAIDSETDKKALLDRLASIARETVSLDKKFDIVENLFWSSVRDAFSELADKDSVGVATGWQVYYEKEKKGECQCEDCVALRNAGPRIVSARIFELPAGGGLFDALRSLSLFGRGDKPSQPEPTDKPNESGEDA